jgi:AraC-like DNA-binding protein
MLRDPEYDILPMNEIALRSGLSSAQHLIRVLRSVYGASPVDIRARRASGE